MSVVCRYSRNFPWCSSGTTPGVRFPLRSMLCAKTPHLPSYPLGSFVSHLPDPVGFFGFWNYFETPSRFPRFHLLHLQRLLGQHKTKKNTYTQREIRSILQVEHSRSIRDLLGTLNTSQLQQCATFNLFFLALPDVVRQRRPTAEITHRSRHDLFRAMQLRKKNSISLPQIALNLASFTCRIGFLSTIATLFPITTNHVSHFLHYQFQRTNRTGKIKVDHPTHCSLQPTNTRKEALTNKPTEPDRG